MGKLLLVGWEGADWALARPMIEAGQLPALAGIVEGGVMGGLAAPEPLVCPALWASAATGRRADAHGVLAWSDESVGRGERPRSGTWRAMKVFHPSSSTGRARMRDARSIRSA